MNTFSDAVDKAVGMMGVYCVDPERAENLMEQLVCALRNETTRAGRPEPRRLTDTAAILMAARWATEYVNATESK